MRRVATEEARLHRSNYWGVRLQKYSCLKKKEKEKGKGGERMRKGGDRKRKKEEQKGKRGGKKVEKREKKWQETDGSFHEHHRHCCAFMPENSHYRL